MKTFALTFLSIAFLASCAMPISNADNKIGQDGIKELESCLQKNNGSPDCALSMRNSVSKMQNYAERIPAIDLANGLYELLVKIKRGEITKAEDKQIAFNKLMSKYQRDIQNAYNQVAQQQQYQSPSKSGFDTFMDGMKEATKITAPPPSKNCTTIFKGNVANTTCF